VKGPSGDERRDYLVEIAKLYYEEDLSQQEIAGRYGISRSTVSNLLKLCRDQGVVEIRINDSSSETVRMERELCARFSLTAAIVVPSNPDPEQAKVHVGRAAASLVEPRLVDGARIGISWGTTLYQLVRHITPAPLTGVQVVQLHGGLGASNPEIDGFGLAQKLAEKLRGTYRIVQSPMVVHSEELRDMLVREPGIAETLRVGATVEIALFGIGSNTPALSSLVRAGYLTEAESLELWQDGAVGTVCGLHVDTAGRLVQAPVARRTIGIDAPTLLAIPIRLGAAAGAAKAEAVLAAIRGRFVNTLVIDQEIAALVLEAR
jgi:deoxyribonucleoside regulator